MRIGHLDLSRHIAGAEEQLVVLVEALSAHGIEQHVLVRNPFLAKRLSVCNRVSVGPVVRSSVTAALLMPDVDIVHVHDRRGATAGMLLNMVKSVSYVVTCREKRACGRASSWHPKYSRAEFIACPSREIACVLRQSFPSKIVDIIGDARNPGDIVDAENGRISAARMAADYLHVYRRALDHRGVPAILI